MKLEICDNTGTTTVICVLILTIGLAAFGGCQQVESTKRKAVEAGLTLQPAKSQSQGESWTK